MSPLNTKPTLSSNGCFHTLAHKISPDNLLNSGLKTVTVSGNEQKIKLVCIYLEYLWKRKLLKRCTLTEWTKIRSSVVLSEDCSGFVWGFDAFFVPWTLLAVW